MSRVGKAPVELPKGVSVQIGGEMIAVKGPKGEVKSPIVPGIKISQEGATLNVARGGDEPKQRAAHGLVRALLANAVTGVSTGFKKELDIVGVGFKAEVKGREVVFALGYSHPVRYPIPPGIEIAVDAKTNHVTITGVDKQRVGQVAAEIRELRPPDVYKLKGIKYSAEVLRKKAGKAGGK
jgi:large subunit ribosomal protein L6